MCRWDYRNLCCLRRRNSCWLSSVAIYQMFAGEYHAMPRNDVALLLPPFFFTVLPNLRLFFKCCVGGRAGVDGSYPYPRFVSLDAICDIRETYKSYRHEGVCVYMSVSRVCVCVCVWLCVLGGFNYLHSCLFVCPGAYLACHLISNMRKRVLFAISCHLKSHFNKFTINFVLYLRAQTPC